MEMHSLIHIAAKVYFVFSSKYLEPPSKTNRIGVHNWLWRCAICTVRSYCRLHTFTINYVHTSGWFCSVAPHELYEYFFTDIWYLGNRVQPTVSVYVWKCTICTLLLWCRLHTFTVNDIHPSGWFWSVAPHWSPSLKKRCVLFCALIDFQKLC